MTAKDPLSQYAQHVTEPEHVFDPEKYVSNCSLTGMSLMFLTAITFQYVRGNSYLTGYLNDCRIEIFGSHLQGYQVYLWHRGEREDIVRSNMSPEVFHTPTANPAQALLDFIEQVYLKKTRGRVEV